VTGLYEVEAQERHIPILHFGMISLDSRMGFVSGGYSRVYFGRYRKQKVALKMIYAMELTAADVHEFFREARMLHELRHPNVVKCMGICVMPPALTVVLEYCVFGSLFDFLHTFRRVPVDLGAAHQDHGQALDDTANSPKTRALRFRFGGSKAGKFAKTDSPEQREDIFRDMYRYSVQDLVRVTDYVKSTTAKQEQQQLPRPSLAEQSQPSRTDKGANNKRELAAAAAIAPNGNGSGNGGGGTAIECTPRPSNSNIIALNNKQSSTSVINAGNNQSSNTSIFNNSHLYDNLANGGVNDVSWSRAAACPPGSFMMDFSTLCDNGADRGSAANPNTAGLFGQTRSAHVESFDFDFSMERINSTFRQLPIVNVVNVSSNNGSLSARTTGVPDSARSDFTVDGLRLSGAAANAVIDVDNAIHSRSNSNVSDIFGNSNSNSYNVAAGTGAGDEATGESSNAQGDSHGRPSNTSFLGRMSETFTLMMNQAGMGFNTSTTASNNTSKTRKVVPFGYCVPPSIRWTACFCVRLLK
jgi:hypothetical protein